ncbi:universal stress protein [uncultured Algibacter sp.]|uniref:universal stress protein n=1 Tax=uncultured Algibacter sp. TaxID=298659 RepID=UPI003217C2D1
MKRILLPTDFSVNAYNAMRYALQLYKDTQCLFYILHTYTPATVTSGSMMDSYSALGLQEIEKENAERNLSETKDELKKEFRNDKHSFKTIASFNLLIPEMKEVVAENNIELIIMGTKGATGAKEIFLGTHTMYTIKKMKSPVIVVPSGFEYEKPVEILFPTDFKVKKSNRYLTLIRDLCETHNSRLHILNAYYNKPLEEEQKRVKVFLDAFFMSNAHLFHIAEDEGLIEAIETFEMSKRVNFLIMIHNKHTLFENLLFRPIINQMVYHTNVPFLVIPSEDRIESL